MSDAPPRPSSCFVCSDDGMWEFADAAVAVETALELAARHARVGVDRDAAHARQMQTRALPGMVVCRRGEDLPGFVCYPLSATAALVSRPRVAELVQR